MRVAVLSGIDVSAGWSGISVTETVRVDFGISSAFWPGLPEWFETTLSTALKGVLWTMLVGSILSNILAAQK